MFVQARIPSASLNDNYNFAVHFTSPIGLLNKAGIKLEVRGGNTSVLLGATHYHAFFPGEQFSIEGRKYLNWDGGKRGQFYGYVKGIGGHENGDDEHAHATDYFGGGIGLGKHINFRHFFIDLNGGLKYVGAVYPHAIGDDTFYFTGPGAVLDIHFNFGFQW